MIDISNIIASYLSKTGSDKCYIYFFMIKKKFTIPVILESGLFRILVYCGKMCIEVFCIQLHIYKLRACEKMYILLVRSTVVWQKIYRCFV